MKRDCSLQKSCHHSSNIYITVVWQTSLFRISDSLYEVGLWWKCNMKPLFKNLLTSKSQLPGSTPLSTVVAISPSVSLLFLWSFAFNFIGFHWITKPQTLTLVASMFPSIYTMCSEWCHVKALLCMWVNERPCPVYSVIQVCFKQQSEQSHQ